MKTVQDQSQSISTDCEHKYNPSYIPTGLDNYEDDQDAGQLIAKPVALSATQPMSAPTVPTVPEESQEHDAGTTVVHLVNEVQHTVLTHAAL